MAKYFLSKTKYLVEFLEKEMKKDGVKWIKTYSLLKDQDFNKEYISFDLLHDEKLFWMGASYQQFLDEKEKEEKKRNKSII